MIYEKDVEVMKKHLATLPTDWDGRQCILELKQHDFHWKQMEWIGFYFEFKARQILCKYLRFPGDKYGSTTFDLKGQINWDLKASAVQTRDHKIILNDKDSMHQSVTQCGYHGEIIACCNVEYDDENRSFQAWHSKLKGGESDYEKKRKKRTVNSRRRKTKAQLREIIFVVLTLETINHLTLHHQGRNSNDARRPPKYMINLDYLAPYHVDWLKLGV